MHDKYKLLLIFIYPQHRNWVFKVDTLSNISKDTLCTVVHQDVSIWIKKHKIQSSVS